MTGSAAGSDPDVAEVLAAVRASAGEARPGVPSPLYRWMWAHHDALLAGLAGPGHRGAWDAIAAALATRGLTDGAGRTPTARVARETWWKVRRAKAGATAEGAPVGTRPVTPSPSPPPLRPVQIEPEPARPRFTFSKTGARPRPWKPDGGSD